MEKLFHLSNMASRLCLQECSGTPAQIAIAWLLQQNFVSALVKASKKSHLYELLNAENIKLVKSDIDLLSLKFPIIFSKSDAIPLS